MKHIFYIVFMILAISALIGAKLFWPSSPESSAAIIINDKVITRKELKALIDPEFYNHPQDVYLDSIITRELLIQQAIAEGINKEEPFVKLVKDFYEQSLIKILMDRKFSALEEGVDEAALNRYVELMNGKVHITVFTCNSRELAGKAELKETKKLVTEYEDLSRDVGYRLLSLNPGEMTPPLPAGNAYAVYRLDRIERLPGETEVPESLRERYRRTLSEIRKEAMIEEWIDRLKSEAKITITDLQFGAPAESP